MFAAPSLHIFFLLLLRAICQLAMADYDPDISNGTCYYTFGEEAPSRFIPCGNAALGHKSCCESLDMCLSSRACYNGQFGVTYLAGCTDSDYEDSSCPDKGDFSDQTWAGLVYCNGTSNEWVACEDDGSTVSVPSTCWCPSTSRTVAFTDASRLTNIMSLPANLGDSVTWEDVTAYASAHSLDSSSPSTAPSSRTTERGLTTLLPPASASTGPDPPATSIPAPTSTPSETAHSPSATPSSLSPISGLDVAQKIGIAFGSVGGAAVILLLAWLVFGCMRRRKRDLRPEPPVPEPVEPLTETAYVDPEMRSPAWSGHKSELPADESTIASPSTGFHEFPRPQSVEVEGSPVLVSPARPTQDGGFRIPGHKGTYYEMAG